MLLRSLLLLGVFTLASCVSFYQVAVEEWHAFKAEYKKLYNEIEEGFRMKIFLENKYYIARHNKLYQTGKKSYNLRMNEFGDMLHSEFRKVMNGLLPVNNTVLKEHRKHHAVSFVEPPEHVKMPSNVDWRDKGAVTPIKNQGMCGSCWAFSTTGSLEGQHFRQTGKLVSLSEQNLIDCSKSYGNNGCNGGLMDYAFAYIRDNKGIDTERSYPYHADDEDCQYNPNKSGAEDKGYVDIRKGSERALKKAVATIGPVSVAIDASHQSFQFYNEGVYNEPECSSDELDHGVLAIGYGVAEDGQAYWLVKNSWGETWGVQGYVKMARNADNMCGIATAASYPLV